MEALSIAAAREPALSPAYVTLGTRRFAFTSYPEVSKAYRDTIEALGLGCSRTPRCRIHDAKGQILAHVAYNGRIFACLPNGESDYDRVLHETRIAPIVADAA